MAMLHLGLPAWLGGIHREEANQPFRIPGHVFGHIVIIHPHPAQLRLAAEYDGLGVVGRVRPILLIAHRAVENPIGPCPPQLPLELGGEVAGRVPGVAVDVYDHERSSVVDGKATSPPRQWQAVTTSQRAIITR